MSEISRDQQTQKILGFALLGICFITIGILYWEAVLNLFERWDKEPAYSHGFLIPLVSLYIAWEKKHTFMPYFGQSSWLALPVCGVAMVIFFMGDVSSLLLFMHYSLIILLFGLALLVFGRGAKHLFVPIVLLGFAIPLPYIVGSILTAKMQLMSSSLGVSVIKLFNIPVYLSGNIIDLGSYKLQVVEACSGLRYLFPLMSLGFIAAYFYQAAMWKRVFVFVSTVPITIVMNSIRIAIVGVLVERYGSSMAEGFLHDFEGWLIFMVCTAILIIEIILIEKLTTGNKLIEVFGVVSAPSEGQSTNSDMVVEKKGLIQFGVILPLFFVMAVVLHNVKNREPVAIESVNLAAFPTQLGENWIGEHSSLEQRILNVLNPTDYMVADYRSESFDGRGVNLYMAYFENQYREVVPHSPQICIPGAGWEISQFSRRVVEGIPVNRAIIQKGVNTQLVYYWFVERGTFVANEYIKKWVLFKDALIENRSDGTIVRVVTPVYPDEDIAAAERRAKHFVSKVKSEVTEALPSI